MKKLLNNLVKRIKRVLFYASPVLYTALARFIFFELGRPDSKLCYDERTYLVLKFIHKRCNVKHGDIILYDASINGIKHFHDGVMDTYKNSIDPTHLLYQYIFVRNNYPYKLINTEPNKWRVDRYSDINNLN